VSDQDKLTGKCANHVAVFLVPSSYSEVSQISHFHKSEIRIIVVVVVVVVVVVDVVVVVMYKSSVFTEIITFL